MSSAAIRAIRGASTVAARNSLYSRGLLVSATSRSFASALPTEDVVLDRYVPPTAANGVNGAATATATADRLPNDERERNALFADEAASGVEGKLWKRLSEIHAAGHTLSPQNEALLPRCC